MVLDRYESRRGASEKDWRHHDTLLASDRASAYREPLNPLRNAAEGGRCRGKRETRGDATMKEDHSNIAADEDM
jgi:hypothetical protein